MTVKKAKDETVQSEGGFGFNLYGSGPVPIRPRNTYDDQPDELCRDASEAT